MKTRTEWYIDPVSGPWWSRHERCWVTLAEARKNGGVSQARARTFRRAMALARATQLVEDCKVDITGERRGRGGKWRTMTWTLARRGDVAR